MTAAISDENFSEYFVNGKHGAANRATSHHIINISTNAASPHQSEVWGEQTIPIFTHPTVATEDVPH